MLKHFLEAVHTTPAKAEKWFIPNRVYIETPEHAIRLLDLPDEFNTINYEKVNYFSIIKPRTMIDIRVGKHTYNLRFAYPERGFSPRNKDRQWMIKYGGE